MFWPLQLFVGFCVRRVVLLLLLYVRLSRGVLLRLSLRRLLSPIRRKRPSRVRIPRMRGLGCVDAVKISFWVLRGQGKKARTSTALLNFPKLLRPAMPALCSSSSSSSLSGMGAPESMAPYPASTMRNTGVAEGFLSSVTLRTHFVSPASAAARSIKAFFFASSAAAASWNARASGVIAASVFRRLEGLAPSGVVGVAGVEADARCMNCCHRQFRRGRVMALGGAPSCSASATTCFCLTCCLVVMVESSEGMGQDDVESVKRAFAQKIS